MANPSMDFNQVIQLAQETGFFEVIIPFLLVFAIVYGVLQAIEFPFKKKGINAVVAFALGMLVTGSGMFTNTIEAFTPYLGVVLFFLLSFLVVLGLVTGERFGGEDSGHLPLAIGVIGFAVVLWLFVSSQGLLGGLGGSGFGVISNNLGIILALGVIVVAILVITRPWED